jgi:hypothetical protein
MFSNIYSMTTLVIVGIVFIIPISFIQKILVKSHKMWLGLILPIIFFLFSIILSIPNFKQTFFFNLALWHLSHH